jgi:hypothetical protein
MSRYAHNHSLYTGETEDHAGTKLYPETSPEGLFRPSELHQNALTKRYAYGNIPTLTSVPVSAHSVKSVIPHKRHSRNSASILVSTTSTLSKTRLPEPTQSKPLAHSSQKQGGIPQSFPIRNYGPPQGLCPIKFNMECGGPPPLSRSSHYQENKGGSKVLQREGSSQLPFQTGSKHHKN